MHARFIGKLSACLLVSALAACENSTLVGDGCEWVPQPPQLYLCLPGETVTVDDNLIAPCDAFTKDTGDFIIEYQELGEDNCGWKIPSPYVTPPVDE